MITGGTSAERVSTARAALASLQGQGDGPIIQEMRAANQKIIDDEYRKYVAQMDDLRAKGLSQRSTDRQALIDKFNPKDAKLAELKADREKLRGLGVNDASSKAALKELDDQIAALGAGYKTAAQQAAALARASRHAASEAAKDARDQAKGVREQAEADRKVQDLKTQSLRGELEIAKALNDPSAIDYAERQLRLQELTVQAARDGLPLAVAWQQAQIQVSREMEAEFAGLKRSFSDAQLAKDQFLTSSQRLSLAEPGKDFIPYSAKTAFLEDMRVSTGQSFHDGLVAGFTGGNFLEMFAARLKYTAANAVADSLTDAAFGKKDGSSSGFFSKIASFGASLLSGGGNGNGDALASAAAALASNGASLAAAGYAAGTQSAVEGYAWVGEEGPELRKLRAGDQIKSNPASMAMIRQVNARAAASAAGNLVVHATFAPVLDARGADAAGLARVEAKLDAMQAGFRENVIGAVNDGMARRQIVGAR